MKVSELYFGVSQSQNQMLNWQLKKLIQHLILLQDHSTDQTCPCELAQSESEKCIPKHLAAIEAYAQETIPMVDSPELKGILEAIAGGASDLLREYKAGNAQEIESWARKARKELEPFYFEEGRMSKKAEEKFREAGYIQKVYQHQPLDEAVEEVRKILLEKGTIDPGDIRRIAEKYGIPYHTLVRASIKDLRLERIDGYRLTVAQSQEEWLFGPVLSPEEAEIPGFGERFERCVLHLKERMMPAYEKCPEMFYEPGVPKRENIGKMCNGMVLYHPYAVCRSVLRRVHGLPIERPWRGRQEEEELEEVEIIHREDEGDNPATVRELERELREKGVVF